MRSLCVDAQQLVPHSIGVVGLTHRLVRSPSQGCDDVCVGESPAWYVMLNMHVLVCLQDTHAVA